jgi:hypothetical protein
MQKAKKQCNFILPNAIHFCSNHAFDPSQCCSSGAINGPKDYLYDFVVKLISVEHIMVCR